MAPTNIKLVVGVWLVVALSGSCGSGQSAGDLIATGRRFLATNDLVRARDSFAAALVFAPEDGTANLLLAATRLLSCVDQPSGKAFLERAGLTITNHGLFGWTVGPAASVTNSPASGLTATVCAAILEEAAAAAANLARVADTNFTLVLTSNETATVDVAVDYGDVLLLRSALEFGKYAGYTLQAPLIDARLVTLRSTFTSESSGTPVGAEEFGKLLSTHQKASDPKAARAALSSAVAFYVSASSFIRNRPTNIIRLFNLDLRMAAAEAKFRAKLNGLGGVMNCSTNK